MFNRNFWNPEQEQLSEMPPGHGVIYKANPRPTSAEAELCPGLWAEPGFSAGAPPSTHCLVLASP